MSGYRAPDPPPVPLVEECELLREQMELTAELLFGHRLGLPRPTPEQVIRYREAVAQEPCPDEVMGDS